VVLKGSGKIIIGGKEYQVTATNVVLCEPNTSMELEGVEEGMSFLNIKTPNPV